MTEEQKPETIIKKESKPTVRIQRINVWKISTIFTTVIIVILIALLLWNRNLTSVTGGFIQTTDSDQIANKTVDFLNKNIIKTGSASLVSVEETSGIYKITISYQGQ